MAAGSYSLQGSRGQQSIAAVQLHLYAGFEGDVFQSNGNSIFQVAASTVIGSSVHTITTASRRQKNLRDIRAFISLPLSNLDSGQEAA